jgi:hypothetical protein
LQPERPRARRYRFVAKLELNVLESGTPTMGLTSNLSLFGCRVDTEKSLPTGTTVWLRITHRGARFEALGRVANVWAKEGMGIVFTKVEEKEQPILEKWIAELRDNQEQS